MTEVTLVKKENQKKSTYATPILDRATLHKTFAGQLYPIDFSTEGPSPYNISRIASTVYNTAKGRM